MMDDLYKSGQQGSDCPNIPPPPRLYLSPCLYFPPGFEVHNKIVSEHYQYSLNSD